MQQLTLSLYTCVAVRKGHHQHTHHPVRQTYRLIRLCQGLARVFCLLTLTLSYLQMFHDSCVH
jgi:hypothetical protein